jgi:hypothetical protein
MPYSNVDLNTNINGGNTGQINTFPDLGILTAVILVPKNTIIPAAQMADPQTFATYVNGRFLSDTRTGATPRWFGFNGLDKFTDETKKVASEDTGRYQFDIYNFPEKFSFRMMKNAGNMGNFIEACNFSNTQANYDVFFIDDLGNWHGTLDQTGGGGLQAYELQQFFVPNSMRRTVTTGNQYMINVQLGSSFEMNGGFRLYQANYDADNIAMLQNAVLNDESATLSAVTGYTAATDIIFTVKIGVDSADFVKAYLGSLTSACFVAYNLTAGAAATIASITQGQIAVGAQIYYYVKARLSASPTSGDKVYVSTAAPSVVNGILANSNIVTESINPTQNGNRYAVKTFA